MDTILGLFNFWVFAIVLMLGLYTTVVKSNLVKKLIGLNIFQAAVFLLYISMNKVAGGTAPIMPAGHDHHYEQQVIEHGGDAHGSDDHDTGSDTDIVFSNPLPQVLILTAIVVGISTTAVGLALAVRIKEAYGTVEEAQTKEMDLTL